MCLKIRSDQPFDASMDDPDIRMHNNIEAGCQGDIQSEGCKVCVRFGRSLHGGLRMLGFPAPDRATGRIITHTPTSLDSTVEISSRDVCWFLLKLRNPPLRIWSSPGQMVMGYADSAILADGRQKLNSLLCCIDLSVVLIFSFWFSYLCLVLKHSGSHRYKCKSHVKYSFIKGASAVVAALANVCRLELCFLPCQAHSRPLAALLPQSVHLSADKKTPAHPAVCQRWCWDTQNSQVFLN